jgi:hypothetical protein
MRVDLVFRWVREHGLAIVGSVLRFVFFLTAVTRREYFFRLVSCGPCGVSSSPSELYPESAGIVYDTEDDGHPHGTGSDVLHAW